VELKDNTCIDSNYEYDRLVTDVMEAVDEACDECQADDPYVRACLKLKAFSALQEKNRGEFESKLNDISSSNKIIQGSVNAMDEKIDDHQAESDYNLNIKGAKLEKKIGDKLGELQHQLMELKKNSAASVFSWKVQALMIVALMFCRVKNSF
jgi:hypothetical protein